MKFHSLLPVRDEEDIIAQCLTALLRWSDFIYVFDTGSADRTWDIVQDLASRNSQIILLRQDAVFFSETRLRSWMFNQARGRMRDGDWFVRVDADEFHHVTPPEFVRTRRRTHETIVYHQYYNFALRASEAQAWSEGLEGLGDRALPIEERRQWFTPSIYSEPRLCKYRSSMRWPPTVSFPFNAGYIARERIPIRHYPHRDPLQLERRCRLRAVMMADTQNAANWTSPELHHWAEQEWRRFITPDDDPELRKWSPGTPLPEVGYLNHLARPHVRLVQRILHGAFLPVLDRLHPVYPVDAYPQVIPREMADRLQRELQEKGA